MEGFLRLVKETYVDTLPASLVWIFLWSATFAIVKSLAKLLVRSRILMPLHQRYGRAREACVRTGPVSTWTPVEYERQAKLLDGEIAYAIRTLDAVRSARSDPGVDVGREYLLMFGALSKHTREQLIIPFVEETREIETKYYYPFAARSASETLRQSAKLQVAKFGTDLPTFESEFPAAIH